MTTLINFVFTTEFLAAIAATIYYHKYKESLMRLLLPLLWYIPINELICQSAYVGTQTASILYNVYDAVVAITILTVTISQLKNRLRKKIVRIFLIICIIGYVLNLTQINPFQKPFSFAPTLSAILIVLGLLYYLIELLKSDRIINVSKDLFLWISVGFLIFFLAYPVLLFARIYLAKESPSLLVSLNTIHYIVAILSYLVIAFGFYYGEKREPVTTQ